MDDLVTGPVDQAAEMAALASRVAALEVRARRADELEALLARELAPFAENNQAATHHVLQLRRAWRAWLAARQGDGGRG